MPDDLPIADEQPQGHRAGAWVVLVIGIVGLALGVYQWHGSFSSAFAHSASTFKTPDQIEAERIDAMKTKDTDKDGLSDYEETYIYKTSPYLADSDSDGIDDKTEVEQGSDPNCPKGKSCGGDAGSAVVGADVSATTSAEAPPSDSTLQAQQQVVNQILNPTPDQVRTLLLQSGMKQADLEKIDDATLMQLYQQSLQEAQTQSNTATSP